MSGHTLPEAELQEALIRFASDGIIVLDEALRVVYLNPAAERLTGWRPEEAIGAPCAKVTGCALAGSGSCHGREAFAQLESLPCVDLPLRSNTGLAVHVNASLAVLPSLHGEPRRLVMTLRDVTEQKAQAAEQQAQYQKTLETLKRQKRQADILYRIGREMVSVLDLEQNLQLLVDETRNLMRTDLAVLMLLDPAEQTLSMRAWSGHLVEQARALSMTTNKGIVWRMVVTGQPGKTEDFPNDVDPPAEAHPLMYIEQLKAAIGHPLMRRGQAFGVLIAANRRPHAWGEEEAALLASVANTAALALENRRLYARLQEAAQQAERQRLAAEIHDGLTQSLYGLGLMLENLEAAAPHIPAAELTGSLRRARRVVAESLTDTRRIIFDLRAPAGQAGVDFLSLLRDQLKYFRHETGMEAELLLPAGPVPDLSRSAGAQVLRIIQEALVNIRKHAGAQRVNLSVRPEAGGVSFMVTDDGAGFDPAGAPAEGHFGLRIMRERAEALGGTCTVNSALGRGTTVTVRVPAGA
jgi:two-component system nitrate/nitrite sensor histidine kinase NarX